MDKITELQESIGKLNFLFYDHLGVLQRDFKKFRNDSSFQESPNPNNPNNNHSSFYSSPNQNLNPNNSSNTPTPKSFAQDILLAYKSVLTLIDDLPEDESLDVSEELLVKIDTENRIIKKELEEKEASMDLVRKKIGNVLEHLAEHSFVSTSISSSIEQNKQNDKQNGK